MEKTIIFGDCHGTGDELEAIINHFGKDCQYISVGDNFDRAGKGLKVWNLIKDFDIQSCLGNHCVKMLDYLMDRRNHLPSHYYQFLNEFSEKDDLMELVYWIDSLPFIIGLEDDALVVHGGINLSDPYTPDIKSNIYGGFDHAKPMPTYPSQGWWDFYEYPYPLVYYGHIGTDEIRRRRSDGDFSYDYPSVINSIGLDTRACFGGKLTAICHETQEVFSVPCKDYFSEIRKIKSEPNTKVLGFREEMKKYGPIMFSNGSLKV